MVLRVGTSTLNICARNGSYRVLHFSNRKSKLVGNLITAAYSCGLQL